MASIEEKVEEHYKKILDELGIRHYGKRRALIEPLQMLCGLRTPNLVALEIITPIFSFFWKIRPPVEFLL